MASRDHLIALQTALKVAAGHPLTDEQQVQFNGTFKALNTWLQEEASSFTALSNKDRAILAQVAAGAAATVVSSGVQPDRVTEFARLVFGHLSDVLEQFPPEQQATDAGPARTASTPVPPRVQARAEQVVTNAFPGATITACPACGNDRIWDNRAENRQRIAQGLKPRPDYKCGQCGWLKWPSKR